MKNTTLALCVWALIGLVAVAADAQITELRSSEDAHIAWADGENPEDSNNGLRGIMGVGNRGDEGVRGLLQFDLPASFSADSITSATLHLWVQQADGGLEASIYRLTQDWVEGIGQWVSGAGMINTGTGATYNSYNGPDNGDDAWPGGAGALGDVATDGGEPIVYGTLSWAVVPENNPGVEVTADVTDLVKSWADNPNYGMLLVANDTYDFNRILTKDFESDDHSAKTIKAAPLLVIEGLGDLSGDVDGDGDVDDDDLSLVLANWGQDTDRAHGELSGTPPVNDDDLSLLLASWTGAAAVPEPATIAMLIAAPVLWRLRRRT